MTDSSPSQQPGWYHAQGDPPGTQRYWDGSQWVGGPQATQDAAGAVGDVAATPAAPGVAPAVGHDVAPPAFAGAGAAAVGVGTGVGNLATYGSRVVAILIDSVIGAVVVAVATALWFALSAADLSTIGFVIFLVGVLVGGIIFPIWNSVLRQGRTGQSLGKSRLNIKLISDTSGGPVGAGTAFVRLLLGGLLTSFCYLDVLWPLFDEQRKRITDKILNLSVVDA